MMESYRICGNRKRNLILSTNVHQKSFETEFLIAICRPTGDKWQSKTMFLTSFDPRSSIVKSVFDRHLSGVVIALVALVPRKLFNLFNDNDRQLPRPSPIINSHEVVEI